MEQGGGYPPLPQAQSQVLGTAHLVEPLHDHVGEMLMQHGRRDDHLVEGLIVAPDGKVRGLLLLTAAEADRANEGGVEA